MNKEKEIIAGITQDNEIYTINLKLNEGRLTMSGETNRPLTYGDAVTQSRERLEDDGGYLWREAVQAKQTELGLNEWIDYVIDTDGEINMIDNSLMSDEIIVDGKSYIFESGSAGQHQEKELKHYFIDKNLFTLLMGLWDRYHMEQAPSQDIGAYSVMENAFQLEQGREELLKKAVSLIEND